MRIVLFICLAISPILTNAQARRAQSLIEKDKHNDAYELLGKAVAKDSLAASEKFVLAALFLNKDFGKNDLDSAYYYILETFSAFDRTEEKEKSKLIEQGFDSLSFSQLKKDIEIEGFERSKLTDSEEAYIGFLEEFSTSDLVDSAIILRNQRAFEKAAEINTYQSYEQFYQRYPDAQEVTEAKKLFEKLRLAHYTADGKLRSFEEFVNNFPESPLIPEAEQSIFNIVAGRHTAEAYQYFIDNYRTEKLIKRATLEKYSILDKSEQNKFLNAAFVEQELRDSIATIQKYQELLLIPIMHEGHYQLIDKAGSTIIEGIDNISETDKCLPFKEKLLLANIGNHSVLKAANGTEISQGDIDISSITYLDEGIIGVESRQGIYFIHESGFRLNNLVFTQAVVAGDFIAYKEKGKWGLMSFTGIAMLAPKYDSIASFNKLIILNKGKKWTVLEPETLYPLLDAEKVELKLPYDLVRILSPDYIMIGSAKKTLLLDSQGQIIVNMADQFIELVDGGYFIERNDSLLDSRIDKKWYQRMDLNENWFIGTGANDIQVFYGDSLITLAKEATILGTTAVLISQSDSTFCYFNDTSRVYLPQGSQLLPISKMGDKSTARHYFFTDLNNKGSLYDETGHIIATDKYEKFIDLGADYILAKSRKGYDVLDNGGIAILHEIDGATSLNSGYLSYLNDDKFGLFNKFDSTNVAASYDRPIQQYTDTIFIVSRTNKYGLIDRNDSLLVPIMYNEIRYLNDTIALLSSNFRWNIWDLANRTLLLDNISDYWQLLKNDDLVLKVFKGIGYGVWSARHGLLLNTTFGEIKMIAKAEDMVYVGEKWVEEADLVVMLYYDQLGNLIHKEIISSAEYNALSCQVAQE